MTDNQIVIVIDDFHQQLVFLGPLADFRRDVVVEVRHVRIIHSLDQFIVVIQVDVAEENLFLFEALANLFILRDIHQVDYPVPLLDQEVKLPVPPRHYLGLRIVRVLLN